MKRLIIVAGLLSLFGAEACVKKSKEVSINPCATTSVELHQSDKVVLNFTKYRPKSFAVVRGGKFWSYIYDSFPAENSSVSDNGTSLSFEVANLTAKNENNAPPVKVFVKSGRYEIYLSDNLDTEPENTVTCVVSVFLSNKDTHHSPRNRTRTRTIPHE